MNSIKKINVGGRIYEICYSEESAKEVLDKIIEWMEDPEHYASYSGEAIMQSDNTLIDAPELISDIVDNILRPKFIKEVDED